MGFNSGFKGLRVLTYVLALSNNNVFVTIYTFLVFDSESQPSHATNSYDNNIILSN